MSDSKDFLSDDEMANLEAKHAPDFISDDNMQEHEMSTGKALLTGAQKGVTLGFEDRLGAGAGAVGTLAGKSESPILDTLKSAGALGTALYSAPQLAASYLVNKDIGQGPIQDRLKALYQAYQEALPEVRQDVEAKRKEAEEAHPTAMLTGELVGSALPFMLTGGAGAAGAAAEKTGATETAGLLSRMGKGALSGAKAGLKEAPMMALAGGAQGAARGEPAGQRAR